MRLYGSRKGIDDMVLTHVKATYGIFKLGAILVSYTEVTSEVEHCEAAWFPNYVLER